MKMLRNIAQFFGSVNGKVLILSVVLVFVLAFANAQRSQLKQGTTTVKVKEGAGKNLVAVHDVLDDVYTITGNELGTTKATDFSAKEVEEKIEQNAFVFDATCFKELNGNMRVEIDPQEPVLRIIPKNGEGYYLNAQGQKFKLSNKYAAHVLVASGNISEPIYPTDSLKTETLQELYVLTQFIANDAILKGLVGQIIVDEHNDLVLVTKNIETQRIILGDITNLENKVTRLKTFYQKVLSVKGWGVYKTINLKFNNQIVAK